MKTVVRVGIVWKAMCCGRLFTKHSEARQCNGKGKHCPSMREPMVMNVYTEVEQ